MILLFIVFLAFMIFRWINPTKAMNLRNTILDVPTTIMSWFTPSEKNSLESNLEEDSNLDTIFLEDLEIDTPIEREVDLLDTEITSLVEGNGSIGIVSTGGREVPQYVTDDAGNRYRLELEDNPSPEELDSKSNSNNSSLSSADLREAESIFNF